MRLRNITMAGIILLVLAFTVSMASAIENGTGNETPMINVTGNATETLTGAPTETVTVTPTATPEPDDDDSDTGIFAPGHLLYRLRIAFENMDETFTYNSSEKLGKQVSHARHRINEYRKALKQNDMNAADMALAQYEEKMSEVNASMSGLSDEDTGYINVNQMIMNHQLILENLSISHPDNKGLQRAYKNSKKLEEKLRSKYVRVETEEHDESEDAKERTQIKAEITDNGSTVNIDLRFQTNVTNETDIVGETLDELKNLKTNLSENLKLEHDDDSTDITGAPTATLTASDEEDSKDYKVKLQVKAKVEGNFTDVKVEFKFRLNETTKSGIVDGINQKLSELNSDEIVKGLELNILEHKKVENSKEIENSRDVERSKQSEKKENVRTIKGGSKKED